MSLLLLFRPSAVAVVENPYYPILDGVTSIVHTFAGVLSIANSDARASLAADTAALGITPTIPGIAGIEATNDR